jgi:hypothetical protein
MVSAISSAMLEQVFGLVSRMLEQSVFHRNRRKSRDGIPKIIVNQQVPPIALFSHRLLPKVKVAMKKVKGATLSQKEA